MATAGAKVLIVEDDDDVRELLGEVLTDDGYQCVYATNGREGLKLLSDDRAIALVLVDLFMPVMSGWELVDALRKHPTHASTPYVVITSAPEQAPKDSRVLGKPISTSELLATARELTSAVRS